MQTEKMTWELEVDGSIYKFNAWVNYGDKVPRGTYFAGRSRPWGDEELCITVVGDNDGSTPLHIVERMFKDRFGWFGTIDNLAWSSNKPIIIRDIESVPTWDPYTRTTLSYPALYIYMYMQDDKIEISYDQDWRTGGTPYNVYTRQVIRAMIDHSEGYPTEPAIRDWLDKEGYDLIRRIDAGHTVDSDGRDYVGILTEDAEEALATIQETYISPTLPYYLADIGDLIEMLEQGMTPNEIKALGVERLEEIALENYMILSRHVTIEEWLEDYLGQ